MRSGETNWSIRRLALLHGLVIIVLLAPNARIGQALLQPDRFKEMLTLRLAEHEWTLDTPMYRPFKFEATILHCCESFDKRLPNLSIVRVYISTHWIVGRSGVQTVT
jgi:hypothetical protein